MTIGLSFLAHAPEVHAAISKLYSMGTSHPEFAQQRAEVSRLLDEQFKGRCGSSVKLERVAYAYDGSGEICVDAFNAEGDCW